MRSNHGALIRNHCVCNPYTKVPSVLYALVFFKMNKNWTALERAVVRIKDKVISVSLHPMTLTYKVTKHCNFCTFKKQFKESIHPAMNYHFIGRPN